MKQSARSTPAESSIKSENLSRTISQSSIHELIHSIRIKHIERYILHSLSKLWIWLVHVIINSAPVHKRPKYFQDLHPMENVEFKVHPAYE
jgi:predicted nucleic acid-binding protein